MSLQPNWQNSNEKGGAQPPHELSLGTHSGSWGHPYNLGLPLFPSYVSSTHPTPRMLAQLLPHSALNPPWLLSDKPVPDSCLLFWGNTQWCSSITQGSFLAVLQEPHGMLDIKPEWAMCRAKQIYSLSLQPCSFCFLHLLVVPEGLGEPTHGSHILAMPVPCSQTLTLHDRVTGV